jgi:hypothetical protein
MGGRAKRHMARRDEKFRYEENSVSTFRLPDATLAQTPYQSVPTLNHWTATNITILAICQGQVVYIAISTRAATFQQTYPPLFARQ